MTNRQMTGNFKKMMTMQEQHTYEEFIKDRDHSRELTEKDKSLMLSREVKVKRSFNQKVGRACNRFLVSPDNKWKMRFDLVIIIMAVWNAIYVPFSAAYGDIDSVWIDIID